MAKQPQTEQSALQEILATAILALFMITFIVQGFEIPSGSMETTFLIGDRLLANKQIFSGRPGAGWGLLPYGKVKRGDVIIFKFLDPPHIHFVKRVIGVPGDRLRIVDRQVFINGEPLEEPYKQHTGSFISGDFTDNFPPNPLVSFDPGIQRWFDKLSESVEDGEVVVPEGHYFVMGDNRDNSQDSRFWGFVPRENIVAKPLFVYWTRSWFD